ncbi:MAG TPA: sulfite exporter TauE/SafE family protein [Burkholderiales bacterium]|jgi:uncharacterized membrane protein YfcA|nr:sulfite exporter TauE/SafE family protein [Burkholderiales bacterium]
MTSSWDLLFVGLAALVAGAVNAIAGGGTLITFPMLSAVGLPPVAATVTNAVALCPGYLGGVLAQARELRGQTRLLGLLLPAALLGGIAGGALLLSTEEKLFRSIVPFLILGASLLTAVQEPLRRWLARRGGSAKPVLLSIAGVVLVVLAAVYGGYFSAGLSVIVLGVLGLMFEGTFTRLNAIKGAISFVTNFSATMFFMTSSHVVWLAALVMALAALVGGTVGGRFASRVRPATLRWCVVAVGTAVGIGYLIH